MRKELGQIPLVTPTSQIVGIQSVNNALFDTKDGEYARITEQVKDLCYGLYGKTTLPIDPEVQKKALKAIRAARSRSRCRGRDRTGFGTGEKGNRRPGQRPDDALIVALYNLTGKKYLKIKSGQEPMPNEMKAITLEEVKRQEELCRKAKAGQLVEKPAKEAPPKPEGLREFDVYVDDEYYRVEVSEKGGAPRIVRSAPVAPAVQPSAPAAPNPAPAVPVAPAPAPQAAPAAASSAEGTPVHSPMPGMFVKYEKNVGDKVQVGETVLVLEAMKMYNNIPSPVAGTVTATPFAAGATVGKGDVLIVIAPE